MIKYRTLIVLVLGSVFVVIGAWLFAKGDIQSSHAWFKWAIGCGIAGVIGLVLLSRKKVR